MLPYKNHFEKLELIKSKKIDLVENVKYFLNRIEKEKRLNAFNFVFEEEALQSAEIISDKIISGNHGALAGLVIGIKDVLSIKDKPLTCSSKILRDFKSIYNATVVQKLIAEDAIIIGKTNCDEFAMGSSNENSAFGNVLNPVDETKVPGGSSGGSAAAVAAFLCDAALGTDTGGSIRQPAAFCGIYGLKPTYSRVSRFGLTAFASSFDSIGPFARSIEDISIILKSISGYDKKDSTSSQIEVPDFTKSLNLKSENIRIGIPKEYFSEGLNEEIKKSILELIQNLKNKNISITEVSLPHTEYTIAAYYILTTAEASSNLARYDSVRFGKRSSKIDSLNEMYKNSRSEGLGAEVKRRIMLGTYVLSAGYYDAYYLKAQKVRRLIKEDFDNAFSSVDVILTPTSPSLPFNIGEKSDDPLEMYLSDIFTTSANLAGIPGISIPYAKAKNGLPIGVQLLAKQFDEENLIKATKIIMELAE
ncbi:MAG: Asp-tRNA(Asn)/Glu-tRNA(Gln) amidotransferase GatCAB subunit A [Chlorobiaceae bacterium]|nr:Asp-tRNA(Asn)/Glu-tRNA(Gln) amidotransferase GatCAB subunit A [Chlorobiaceae bacterium]MBA4310433.1 Asp-tRNA(Asn)/Glu-tRNA(Gln) amidotransferase GatCAB subunit A [Chlorobiaceae bacterium]